MTKRTHGSRRRGGNVVRVIETRREGAITRSKPKDFIVGIHDRRAEAGPPPALLKEYAEMEAQIGQYKELRDTWLPMT